MTSVIVAGAIANKPLNGGEAWARLGWALGLRRLGIDVHLIEVIAPSVCVDRHGRPACFEDSLNRTYFTEVIRSFYFEDAATLISADPQRAVGVPYDEVLERAARATLLINISGHLKQGALFNAPRGRVYVDLDPGFTQLWGATSEIRQELDRHEHHVTVGMNVGRSCCPLPTGGFDWLPTLPPVILDEWPQAELPSEPTLLTTIATWRSPYGQVEFDGELQGLKHHEFRKLLELPERVRDLAFEIALDIHPDDALDLESLRAHGWRVVDPRMVAGDPGSYREYVQASAAEFSVAQGVYVSTRSGWFSDRTACYLASGRPALVQDTGIGSILPVGEGLVLFHDLESAVRGAQAIAADYAAHSRAARHIAERYLDSGLVLEGLLDRLVGDRE